MPTLRQVGSGYTYSKAIRFGNAVRGYKEFAVVDDDAEVSLPAQRFEDVQALDGTMWRHTFQPEPKTWTFPVLVEDYWPFEHYAWLESIQKTGMGETFNLWDHRTWGDYETEPVTVLLTSKITLKVRNHDIFLYDATLNFRKVQP